MAQEYFYHTPLKISRCNFTVQGSRFFAALAPVDSESSVNKMLTAGSNEYPDATHHTYAYRIGTGSRLIERYSDDREPAGTAGVPMMQILQGSNVSDAIVIATRYFGGTKLGIGGLTRAYRDCARLSLKASLLIKKEPLDQYSLKFAYEDLGSVTRLIESNEGKIMAAVYGEAVIIKTIIPSRLSKSLIKGFESACRGKGLWELI